VGVNGVDFVARQGTAYIVEINPRWSASMDLMERACGLSLFAAHARACEEGVLPAFDLRGARRDARASGKAIVFARQEVVPGDSRAWLDDEHVRDVPAPGVRIPAGGPICTVYAEGPDTAACRAMLVERAARIHRAVAVSASRSDH
jgi:predicted ATP-grasp superfamily ATP-dependent carboligase